MIYNAFLNYQISMVEIDNDEFSILSTDYKIMKKEKRAVITFFSVIKFLGKY